MFLNPSSARATRELTAAIAAVVASFGVAGAGASSPSPTSTLPGPRFPPAVPVALHDGASISDRQLFAYLSYPVSPGDWVRYRVEFADGSTVDKTVGFGRERIGGASTLFIETHVRAQPVSGLPAETTIGIGTDAVLKTYVTGPAFGDLAHVYGVVSSALKVSGFEYEIPPGAGASYSVLTGAVDASPRYGTLRSIGAVDMRLGHTVVHSTRLVASFPAAALPAGGVDLAMTVEIWQSPDVPLGTVAIKSGGSRFVDWRLIAFGRGGYRSMFSKTLDQIRSASQPAMP